MNFQGGFIAPYLHFQCTVLHNTPAVDTPDSNTITMYKAPCESVPSKNAWLNDFNTDLFGSNNINSLDNNNTPFDFENVSSNEMTSLDIPQDKNEYY